MKFRIWVLIELHLKSIVHFSLSFKIFILFKILWLFILFILWKTLLPIGLRTGPVFNPYGNTQISIFFQKSLKTGPYSGENLRVDFQPGSPPNTIHGDSQSENQTENRDENQVLLWEPPNTRPEYWSGPLVPSN